MTEYKVALDVYNGPMDLLLFLIRRDEIDIYDIPIARVTEQYVAYVDLLTKIDPEVVSEFLVLAATLLEIKSRTLLPRPPIEEDDEEIIDPRVELVRQLLEYKKYKDVARSLEDSAAERALRHARLPAVAEPEHDGVPLESVDIWDLFGAFNRLLTQIGKAGATHHVGVDDTPIALHATDIVDSIERAGGKQEFEDIFRGRARPELIGLFLALLELIRQRRIRAIQERSFGPIRIVLLDSAPLDDVAEMEVTLPEAEIIREDAGRTDGDAGALGEEDANGQARTGGPAASGTHSDINESRRDVVRPVEHGLASVDHATPSGTNIPQAAESPEEARNKEPFDEPK